MYLHGNTNLLSETVRCCSRDVLFVDEFFTKFLILSKKLKNTYCCENVGTKIGHFCCQVMKFNSWCMQQNMKYAAKHETDQFWSSIKLTSSFDRQRFSRTTQIRKRDLTTELIFLRKASHPKIVNSLVTNSPPTKAQDFLLVTFQYDRQWRKRFCRRAGDGDGYRNAVLQIEHRLFGGFRPCLGLFQTFPGKHDKSYASWQFRLKNLMKGKSAVKNFEMQSFFITDVDGATQLRWCAFKKPRWLYLRLLYIKRLRVNIAAHLLLMGVR